MTISNQQPSVQNYSSNTMNGNSAAYYGFYDNQNFTPSSTSGSEIAASSSAGYSIQNILNFAAQQYAKSKKFGLTILYSDSEYLHF